MTRPESLDEAPCFLNTAEYKAKLNILIENPIRIRRSCSDLLTTEFPEYKGSFVAGRSKKKVAKGATDNGKRPLKVSNRSHIHHSYSWWSYSAFNQTAGH